MNKPVNLGNIEIRRPDGDVVWRFSSFRQAVTTLVALEAGAFELFEATKGGKSPRWEHVGSYEAA